MPRTTARGNVIKSTKKKKKSKSTANSTAAKALTSAVKNVNTHAATVAKASQATSTGSSSNTKSSGSSKMQGTTTFTAPTLSETIKNLSNAAKKGSAVQTPSSQKVSVPLFDHHQTTAQRGGSVLGSGDSSLYKGRTFVNPQGKTVAVNPAKNNADTKNQSNSAKGNTVSNAISSGHTGVRGTSVLQAPTLSETIKNLSDAAKEAKANEKTPTQKISSANVTALNNMSKKAGVKNDSTSGSSNILPTLFPTAESNYQSPAEQMADNAGYDTLGIHPSKGILSVQQSPVIKDTQTVKESAQAAFDKAVALTGDDDPFARKGTWVDNHPSTAGEVSKNVSDYIKYWDYIPEADRYDVAMGLINLVGVNDQTHDVIMQVYNSSSGQDKADMLNAMTYVEGHTDEIDKLFADMSDTDRMKVMDERINWDGNHGFNELLYYAALKDERTNEFEKEWAKEHYSTADALTDAAFHSVATAGASIVDAVTFIAADFLQNKDKIDNFVSPLDGTKEIEAENANSLIDAARIGWTELLKVTGNLAYDVLNFAAIGPKWLVGSQLSDEWADKAADSLLSLTDDYYKEKALYQLHVDAANIPGGVKTATKVIDYVGQALPAIALAASGYGSPAAVTASRAGLAEFGVQAGGQAARQAYESGASLKDSLAYGVMSAMAEVGTEKLLSGFGWFGKGIVNTVAKKTGGKILSNTAGKSILSDSTQEVLNGFKNSPFGQALTYFVHSGAEASEEMVGQVLQTYLQRATYDPDAKNATMKEVLAAGGYGFVVSGILGLPQTVHGLTSAAADSASAKEYTNQMKEMAATQISNIQELVKSKQISPIQARSAIKQITDSVQKSIAKVSGSRTAASAQQGNTNNFAELGTNEMTVNSTTPTLVKTQEEAVADFQQSPYGAALSYFAAHGVKVSPEEAGLVYQAYLKDSSGEDGSELTSTSGQQGESSQPGASVVADSSANKSGASAPPNIVAAQEESAEDSPHVVSSQEEAIAELRKVATTKKTGEWISVVKVDGKGATQYTALVSPTHDIQQVQSGVADPAAYKGLRGKQAENQAANELKKTSQGGILDAGRVGGATQQVQTGISDITQSSGLSAARDEEKIAESGNNAGFKYKHNPSKNPKVLSDANEDSKAIYGYRPSKEGSLKAFADGDWTNPNYVEKARQKRIVYHERNEVGVLKLISEMRKQGYNEYEEPVVRSVVEFRNQSRLSSYLDAKGNIIDQEGYTQALEHCKTYEQLKAEGKTNEDIIKAATRGNPGMDACTGLYDNYHDQYKDTGEK